MGSSNDDIFGVVGRQVAVPAGSTLAVFVEAASHQQAVTVKYFSGGTLEIQGTPTGSTLTPGTLVPGTGYILGASEAVNIEGPCRFYLLSQGATSVACLLHGLAAPGYTSIFQPPS